MSNNSDDNDLYQPLRWGFVGTGRIATWMADVVRNTRSARIHAVASRNISTAQSFVTKHGGEKAFDSWEEMLDDDALDAVYVATPTSLREEISIAAAKAGKHVLGEKPFASLASLQRITTACREHDVGFMDATHFVHHPRYSAIRRDATGLIGAPRLLDTRFLISLTDRSDIRYHTELEPLGAAGDLGWYNMRATVEYLAAADSLRSVTTQLQRDQQTGAIIACEGSLTFDNDLVSTWRCSFVATSVDIGLTLTASDGILQMDNFIGEDGAHAASFRYSRRDTATAQHHVAVPSALSGPALMFGDFAAMASDASLRDHWMRSSEHTQQLLDAAVATADSG